MIAGLKSNTVISGKIKKLDIALINNEGEDNSKVVGNMRLSIFSSRFCVKAMNAVSKDEKFYHCITKYIECMSEYMDDPWDEDETFVFIESVTVLPEFRGSEFYEDLKKTMYLWLDYERADNVLTIPEPDNADFKDSSVEWLRSFLSHAGFIRCFEADLVGSEAPVWMLVPDDPLQLVENRWTR